MLGVKRRRRFGLSFFKQITGAHGRSGKISRKRDPQGDMSWSEEVNVTKETKG